VQIFKRVGPAAIRLLVIPGICEAFFDGGLATALFGMPVTFAFALGFILTAIGPALVIQCMFEVQQKRLGLDKAIPATVVAAASFDGESLRPFISSLRRPMQVVRWLGFLAATCGVSQFPLLHGGSPADAASVATKSPPPLLPLPSSAPSHKHIRALTSRDFKAL